MQLFADLAEVQNLDGIQCLPLDGGVAPDDLLTALAGLVQGFDHLSDLHHLVEVDLGAVDPAPGADHWDGREVVSARFLLHEVLGPVFEDLGQLDADADG